MYIFLFFLYLIENYFVHLRMFNLKYNKMKASQKITVVVFLILGSILIANQLINNFNFTI
jgi:hypothetical protein